MPIQRALLIVLSACLMSCSASLHAAPDDTSREHLLLTSNDYLELVREYWPAATSGTVEAMVVVFDALNNCWHFRTEIQAADNVDELVDALSNRHPQDQAFAKGSFYRCKNLVERYAEFPDWQSLRLRAALAGDAHSKIMIAISWYNSRDRVPRHELAFSPAAFVVESLESGQHTPLVIVALDDRLLVSPSIENRIAWQLAACDIRGNCHRPESMRAACGFMVDECAQAGNMYELLRIRAGSDATYAAAARHAEHLRKLIDERRYDELGLDLVW